MELRSSSLLCVLCVSRDHRRTVFGVWIDNKLARCMLMATLSLLLCLPTIVFIIFNG